MATRTRTSAAQPAATPASDELPRELMRAMDGMFLRMLKQTNVQEMSRMNTSPHESRSLGILLREGPLLMSELAKSMEIPLSSATNLVNRLVEKGHVARERSDEDRRIVRVTVTASGRRLMAKLEQFRLEASRHALTRLDTAEQRTLIALLRKTAE
ncbi:MarR family winged helix-turn-helix transcriptional regulator [Terriglobus roseus]|uniref:DNA-binding transcriptional regulator, MarR family n=1 Tax=Terriglobus roseus TaxID=392734 RepID=A0A1H4LR60_9BACT|nr:MarR family transcriptional regulator [Terriglobus roseus]SEB73096.1 DNA-binding transcriptional regulator, MarR family [Terriglobus roseus]